MAIAASSELPLYKRLTERFSSYTIVGVSTFLLDMGMIWWFVNKFELRESMAIALAFILAVHVNYTILRFWVYRKTPEAISKTYTYFVTVALIVTFLMPTLVAGTELLLDIDMFPARIIAGGAVGLFGFCFNTFFNFKLI